MDATRDFRDEVLALQAALDALPLEKTVTVRFDTSGMPGAFAAAAAAGGTAVPAAGGAEDAAAQADALRTVTEAAYADAAAQEAAAAATQQGASAAADAAKNEYLLAMAERMRANTAREAAAAAAEARGAEFDQTAVTLASIDATLAAARASTVYGQATAMLEGDTGRAGFATRLFTNAITAGIPVWESAGGQFGFLRGKLQLFGGQLTHLGMTTFPAVIAGWHLMGDAIIETAATLLPAAIAFGTFAAAAVPAVQDIYHQMQNLHTVNDALGTSLYPLTGKFSAMAQAVRPEVYTLFGEALDLINSKADIFSQVAREAGKVLDDLGARFVYAVTSGSTFSTFLHNAAGDLAGWGNLVGNVGGIIGNVFSVLPGYAGILLTVAQDITHVAEVASAAAEPLLRFGLAAHGALLYMGLAATGGAWAVTGLLTGVASLSLNAATRLAGLGAAGEAAAGGLLAVGGAAEAAAAMPWGWILAAAAGLGVLVYRLAGAKDAAQQFGQSMQDAVKGASLGMLLPTVAGAIASTQQQIAASSRQVSAALQDQQARVTGVASRYAQAYNPALDHAATLQMHYQQGLAGLQQTQVMVAARVNALSKEYGGNAAAMALMNAAGITSAQVTDTNNQHWAQALIEIRAQADAYRAMALGAGRARAAMNALGGTFMTETLPALQKMTQAEDAVMNVILAGPQAFVSYQQALGQMGTDAGKAGASLGGLNAQSLTLAADFYGTSVPALQKVTDALQQQDISTGNLKKVLATGAGEMLKYTKGNLEAQSVIMALINNALSPGTVSLKTLDSWVKNNSTSLQGMNAIIAQSAIQAGTLAGVLQAQLNAQFRQFLLQSSGASAALRAYTSALVHNQASTASGHGLRAQLIRDLELAGMSALQATQYVDGLSAAIHRIPSSQTVTIHVSTLYTSSGSPAAAAGAAYASGGAGHAVYGPVYGAAGMRVPGHGHGDIVPAMLEPGEAVVPRHLVHAIAPFLAAHHVPGFASGGYLPAGRSGAAEAGGRAAAPTIEVHLHGDLARDGLWEHMQVQTLDYNYANTGRTTGKVMPGR